MSESSAVTVVFDVSLAPRLALLFMEDFLEYSADIADEQDYIKACHVVEVSGIEKAAGAYS
jgi:hypothetical protein